MTERLGALLTELADLDSPRVPSAEALWRRARRTKTRRRALLVAAAVGLGAGLFGLTGLPGLGTDSIRRPASGETGPLQPLPPRLTELYGEIPLLAQRPTDRIQLLFDSYPLERVVGVPRVTQTCTADGCANYTITVGVGSDHAYRLLVDPRSTPGPIRLAPDGRHAAVLLTLPVGPTPIDQVDALEPSTEEWRLLDLVTSQAVPSVRCTGATGWTRDGYFVCIPTAADEPVERYRVDPGGGLSRVEIPRHSVGGDWIEVSPELLGPSAEVMLGSSPAGPSAFAVTDLDGRVLQTVRYPGVAVVSPHGWCGPDTVLVDIEARSSVIGLDGVIRSVGPAGWRAAGCRPDGSLLMAYSDGSGLWLAGPDGARIGAVQVPAGGIAGDVSQITGVAIDAFSWEVGGPTGRVAAPFRATDWVDEAGVALGVGGLVWLLVRRRRHRLEAAAGELA